MGRTRSGWIQRAIRRPGSLRRAAARAGALTKTGNIRVAWLRAQAAKGDRRAALALTLRRLRRKS